MDEQQSQADPQRRRPIGFTDPTVRELARAAVTAEEFVIHQTEVFAAEREAWQAKETGYKTKAQDDAETIAALKAKVAKLEAHRCPVLGELGEGDDPSTLTLVPDPIAARSKRGASA